jgi:cell division protein FtsX
MNDISNIERTVMQRVHLIRALRYAISGAVLSLLLSFISLWGIGRTVWVARVFENAPHDSFGLVWFYWNAFLHTRLAVEVLCVILFGTLVYTFLELSRSLRSAWSAGLSTNR